MFKIISGDFSKNSICTFESILETGKGFETTKTLLKNAQEIRLLSDEEINQLIQNSDYALYIKDLKKAIKDDNTVCFYYKYKNKKEFTAIADLKTYQLVANKAKEEIPEEKLTTVSSSKNGCLLLIAIAIILFILVSCVGNHQTNTTSNDTQTNNKATTSQKPVQNTVKVANAKQVNYLKGFLKPGFQIVDENRVYYTRSKDYQNAYFVGTMVRHINRLELCIWFSNRFEDTSGTILSANDGAVYSSYPLDARKTDIQVKSYDDGYNKIHNEVLKHFNELAR